MGIHIQKVKSVSEKVQGQIVCKGILVNTGSGLLQYILTYVVRHTTLRLLFVFAAQKNLKIQHPNIKFAFLHSENEKPIYLHQPQGYITPGLEDKVCMLKRVMYGLKHANRA